MAKEKKKEEVLGLGDEVLLRPEFHPVFIQARFFLDKVGLQSQTFTELILWLEY